MRPTRIIATGAAILALVLGACSASTTSGTGQQAPAATVAPASTGPTTVPFPGVSMPSELLGVWTANVQREGPTSGIWRLRVTDHLMELKNPQGASDADYFWLWTDRIDGTSFHEAADADCSQATYQWAITAGQLVMTTADDTCGDRKVILTTPFKRDQ